MEHQWKKTEHGSVDEFALNIEDSESIPHNGPLCEVCGFSGCIYCVWRNRGNIFDPEQFPCPGPPPEGTNWYFHGGSDPSSIPDGTWEDD